MFNKLLRSDIQQFIAQNLHSDVAQLALKPNPFPEVDWSLILQQIQARQKSEKKLPTWFATPNVLYPTKLSIEQCSSEILAKHKSKAINGKKIIDLTGGFGVDTYYFAQTFEKVIHAEINTDLCQIVAHNAKQLNLKNLEVKSGDGREILTQINQQFDWIYIDPARRDQQQKKVFRLSDCTPNVVDLLDDYFAFSDKILIKTAPLLDISQGLKDLPFVEKIEIVSLQNEVRELLWYINKNNTQKPKIVATDYSTDEKSIQLSLPIDDDTTTKYSNPLQFLYEPSPALMKSGNFNYISRYFDVEKLDQNAHLYTSTTLKDFWGRRFKVLETLPFSKKTMKNWTNQKANISCRNFPMKPEEIKKKFKIKDGGDQYLFFSTTDNGNKKLIIITEKIV